MDDALSPERQQAQTTFMHAMEQFRHGHLDNAFELAETATEYDGGYLDVRRWLAEQYEAVDEPRKASRHLQVIVHHIHDDADAWAALDRVDPQAAERIRRATELPPDPFVSKHTKALDDFGDLEDMDEMADDGLAPRYRDEGLLAGEVDLVDRDFGEIEDIPQEGLTGVVPGHGDLSDILDLDDEDQPAGEPEAYDSAADPVPEAAAVSSPPPPDAAGDGPMPWEHEQDRQYRDMMLASELLAPVVNRVVESWQLKDSWQSILADCAHASQHSHADLYKMAGVAAAALGGPGPVLLIAPEGSPHCIPLRSPEAELAINTGLMRTLQGQQLVFALARVLAVHRAGHAPFFHTTLMVTERPSRLLGICEEAIREYLWDLMGSWFESHPKPDRQAAAALAHAWQLRAELSCDRAGLLACGDLTAACDAIAKTCCSKGSEAQHASGAALLEKHAADDVGQLAAIPVDEDPRYNEGYGVYRIQMLRWWATTPEYQALAAAVSSH